MATADLTAQRLRELLHYNPETGVFTRMVSRGGEPSGRRAGSASGGVQLRTTVTVDGKKHYAYRLAWLYMKGEWPTGDIDHINGDCHDDRFSNLRDVPHQINQQNQRRAMSSNKSSTLIGVSFSKEKNAYKARVKLDGKEHFVGYFGTAEEAHTAYVDAKRRIHAGCTL